MTPADLLNKHNVPYRESGRDLLVLCFNPEHDDTNPSMRIDKILGVYNCLSCGFKGSLYTYYDESPKGVHNQCAALREKIINKRTESLGMDMPIGHVPYFGTWRGISSDTYRKFEAFEHADPNFIARVNIPIKDISGRIVAFIGRHTGDGTPKYKIVPPNAKLPLFPLHLMEPIQSSVILVEGMYDFLNCYQAGFTNAICCFGTRMVSEHKLKILKVRGVDRIDIFFDGDEAGQKAAVEIKEKAEKLDFDTRNICIEGKDPGQLSQGQLHKLKEKLYG
jgi:DNA primase